MVIAGAGGHGKEIFALIQNSDFISSCVFYDENPQIQSLVDQKEVIRSKEDLSNFLSEDSDFVLGVGNPEWREKLDHFLTSQGGLLKSIHATSSVIQSNADLADVMSFGFVGPSVKLGRGVLINTRAHVHHDCQIGSYTEIGPGAIVLGNAKTGEKCRIGAGSVILPGITLGDQVVVGAGAVVTKNISSGMTVVGVPAKPLNPAQN